MAQGDNPSTQTGWAEQPPQPQQDNGLGGLLMAVLPALAMGGVGYGAGAAIAGQPGPMFTGLNMAMSGINQIEQDRRARELKDQEISLREAELAGKYGLSRNPGEAIPAYAGRLAQYQQQQNNLFMQRHGLTPLPQRPSSAVSMLQAAAPQEQTQAGIQAPQPPPTYIPSVDPGQLGVGFMQTAQPGQIVMPPLPPLAGSTDSRTMGGTTYSFAPEAVNRQRAMVWYQQAVQGGVPPVKALGTLFNAGFPVQEQYTAAFNASVNQAFRKFAASGVVGNPFQAAVNEVVQLAGGAPPNVKLNEYLAGPKTPEEAMMMGATVDPNLTREQVQQGVQGVVAQESRNAAMKESEGQVGRDMAKLRTSIATFRPALEAITAKGVAYAQALEAFKAGTGDFGPVQRFYREYSRLLRANGTRLARAFGEVGVVTAPDVENALNALPDSLDIAAPWSGVEYADEVAASLESIINGQIAAVNEWYGRDVMKPLTFPKYSTPADAPSTSAVSPTTDPDLAAVEQDLQGGGGETMAQEPTQGPAMTTPPPPPAPPTTQSSLLPAPTTAPTPPTGGANSAVDRALEQQAEKDLSPAGQRRQKYWDRMKKKRQELQQRKKSP